MIRAVFGRRGDDTTAAMKCWLLTLTALCLGAARPSLSDLPPTFDWCEHPSGVSRALWKSAMPHGGRRAGNYSIVDDRAGKRIASAVDCAHACCSNLAGQRCDVALFRRLKGRMRCILVKCDAQLPRGCDPVSHQDEPKFRNAYMIRLRRLTPPPVRDDDDDDSGASPRDRLCSPDSVQAKCPQGELCRPNSDDGSYICVCSAGHVRVRSGHSVYGRCVVPPTAPPKPDRPSSANATVATPANNSTGTVGAGVGAAPKVNGSRPVNATGGAKRAVTSNTTAKRVSLTSNSATTPSPHSPAAPTTAPSKPAPLAAKPPPPRTSPVPDSAPSTLRTSTHVAPTTARVPFATTAKPRKPSSGHVQPTVRKLDIVLLRNYTIQLPRSDLALHSRVRDPPAGEKLSYHWSLVSNPDGAEKGVMDGKTSPDLHLSKLIAGDYVFKLIVQGRHSYGETTVKVVVLSPKRINKPPVAIVKSDTEVVQLPNNLVLDGTRSSDDDRVVSYNWEEVSGPLVRQDMKGNDKGILELKGLLAGHYVFKLTVTDSDGATNSTQVNVTVVKEKDYPPTANAGQTIVLTLPQNSVTLYGNASTDDHGIVKYEWVKISNDKLTADMQGTQEPLLRLSHLEQGDYTFQLKVTDTAGQTSTAQVKVYVNPQQNVAPTANAGPDRTVTLPLQVTSLDGSKSEDDAKIVKYEWTQISGPHTLILKSSDKAKVEVSNLKVGSYKFQLRVWDKERLESKDTIVLTVQESKNIAPKARAGDDQLVLLPQNLIRLDGSRSWDDKAIVSYEWSRTDDSLAAGTVLNKSDHLPVLLLTDLVAGKYSFNLVVADAEGLRSSDRINVIVKDDKNLKNVLEIRFKGNLQTFTESNKADLTNQFKLLLSKAFPDGDIRISVERMRQIHDSGSIVMRFFVTKRMRTSIEVLPGRAVLRVLRQRLRSGVTLLDLAIERVDTAVCQSNCSGHGRCHPLTRECVCEAFWMENTLRVRYGDGEHNCDWSILYLIVICCAAVLLVAVVVWFIIWYRRRWRRPRTKRHKYTLLNEFDEKDGGLKLASLPHRNGGKKSRRSGGGGGGGGGPESGMVASESDLTSDDEETLFVNKRPINGGVGSTGGSENKAYLRSNGVAGAL